MNAPQRPRHNLLVGKRISTIQWANPTDFTEREWRTLLIRFTDGTVAYVEACSIEGEPPFLEVEVDGY